MKKSLKRVRNIFLVLIVFIIGFVFVFRGRIGIYLDVAKKYAELKDTPISVNTAELEPLESMDHKDVIYKTRGNNNLTLDIYDAKKKLKKGSPVILYVHGGSWAYGDKTIPSVISPLLDNFRDEGFTIISTSYELTKSTANFDEQASDVKDTIRWIYKNKDKYNFDTENIGVIGVSAGAHLTLLSTYSDNNEFQGDEELKNYSSDVKYVIDFFGPTDLTTLNVDGAGNEIKAILNNTKDRSEVLKQYSPINYVKEGLPKTLIIHSKADEIVPYDNSLELYNKSKDMKNKVNLITLEKSGHDLSNINKEEVMLISTEILKFVVKNYPLF